jgi:hypothetical protein
MHGEEIRYLSRAELGDTIVRFAMSRSLALFTALLLVSSLGTPAPADPSPLIQSSYGPLPIFEFHSGFWFNLHHTLYQAAKEKESKPAQDKPPNNSAPNPSQPILKTSPVQLTTAEQHIWDDAVSYYTANFIGQDLLFSTDMILLKNQLAEFEDCDELSGVKNRICNANLPTKLTQILEAVAPVYRAHQWPDHDRTNRRWILRVAPLVREQGVGLSERLADIYQTRWPKAKIRVDVSAYANASGAYTTIDPLRVTIASADPRNQDAAALEVLFHEASHGIAEPIQEAIIRECRQRGKPIPRDLWHALIFYTTGEVIRPVMEAQHTTDAVPPAANAAPTRSATRGTSSGIPQFDPNASVHVAGGYIPYAVREGLYQRGWDDYLQVLTRFWQPYLDGQESYDDAVARMVSSL